MSYDDAVDVYKEEVFKYLKDRGKVCIAVIEPLIPKPALLLHHRARLIDILADDRSGRFVVDDFEFSLTNNATVRRADEMYHDSEGVLRGYRDSIEHFLKSCGGHAPLSEIGSRLRRPEALASYSLSQILLADPQQRFASHPHGKVVMISLVSRQNQRNGHPDRHIKANPPPAMNVRNSFAPAKSEGYSNISIAPISHPPRAVVPVTNGFANKPRQFTREENNYYRAKTKTVNRPLAESSGDMTDTVLAASRLRDFILSLSKDSISVKKNGDLRQFYIKYPEYEELIRVNGGLKRFCSQKNNRKFVVWKDPVDKTDQIGKIFVAMSSL